MECSAKWRASLGKLVAKGEKLLGKARVSKEVCELIGGSKRQEQKQKQGKESRKARKARGEKRREKAQEADCGAMAVAAAEKVTRQLQAAADL